MSKSDKELYAETKLKSLLLRESFKDSWLLNNYPEIYRAQQLALQQRVQKQADEVMRRMYRS